MKQQRRDYLQHMLLETLDNVLLPDMKNSLPNVGEIPENIATKEKPEKGEAVKNMRTRFHF